MSQRTVGELTDALSEVTVVNVCEYNRMPNAGDHASAVGRNIRWVSELGEIISLYEAQSLAALHRSPLQGKLVIVGGSGLVGPGRFETAVESIFPQKAAATVVWGIGHNMQHGLHLDPASSWRRRVLMDGRTRVWPEWLASANLVGVRDYGAGLPWVPCASCMSPHFDELRDVDPIHHFAVINHYERPIDTRLAVGAGLEFPHSTNNTEDVLAVLQRIASARVVVSNSYHVLYWALLMGRAAVCFEPNSTRFGGYRWPVEVAHAEDWLAAVERAQPSPRALEEAREATVEFSERVLGLARGLGLVPMGATVSADAAIDSFSPEEYLRSA